MATVQRTNLFSDLAMYQAQARRINLDDGLHDLKRGLKPQDQEELDILYGGPEPQHIVFTNIPYVDHNGNKKVVVSAVYNLAQKTLPSQLPTLLPPLARPPARAIRNIPGKGKGMIATRNIALGELVIVERPVLVFPRVMFEVDALVRFQMHAKQSMDPSDWDKFNDLANVKDKRIVSEFDGIRTTNAFGISLERGKENYSGLFFELSRLNHSCGPNLRCIWNPALFTFSVQAVRPIRKGQELTVSYLDTSLPLAERQSILQSSYNFTCKCTFCKNPSPTSDYHRETSRPDDTTREFDFMYDNLIKPGLLPRLLAREQARVLLDSLVGGSVTITKEGLESMSALVFYVCLMKISGVLGDKKQFKEWGFKAVLSSVKYVETEGGKAGREVERWIDWVREPEKKFPAWGRLR